MSDRLFPEEAAVFGGMVGVREEYIDDDRLGYFDPTAKQIVIHSDQPRAAKWVIFVHELIHAAEMAAIGEGAIDENLPEAWVEAMGCNVAGGIAEVGAAPVEAEDFYDLIRKQSEDDHD